MKKLPRGGGEGSVQQRRVVEGNACTCTLEESEHIW